MMDPVGAFLANLGFGAVVVWALRYLIAKLIPQMLDKFEYNLEAERKSHKEDLQNEREDCRERHQELCRNMEAGFKEIARATRLSVDAIVTQLRAELRQREAEQNKNPRGSKS